MSPVPPDEPGLLLTLALVNTHDLLAKPVDKLTVELAAQLAARHERADLASELRAVPEARRNTVLADLVYVRGLLYQVFAAPTAEAKAAALDTALARVAAVARMVPGPRLGAVTHSADPVHRLGVYCADALAQVMTAGAGDRLGTCAAHPCRCGFIDRTRAARQRFCCQLCNDRMAAAAYRARRSR